MTPAHITEARKALGMRVIHFAEMLGVAESAVRYWEKGQRKMPRQSFLFLRAIYRCPELRQGLPDVSWNEEWGEI